MLTSIFEQAIKEGRINHSSQGKKLYVLNTRLFLVLKERLYSIIAWIERIKYIIRSGNFVAGFTIIQEVLLSALDEMYFGDRHPSFRLMS